MHICILQNSYSHPKTPWKIKDIPFTLLFSTATWVIWNLPPCIEALNERPNSPNFEKCSEVTVPCTPISAVRFYSSSQKPWRIMQKKRLTSVWLVTSCSQMKIIKCPCFQGILKTPELRTYTLQLLLSCYVSYIWFSMKLFSAVSSAVRVPLEDNDLISHIPLAFVKHLCGYRGETTIKIRPCPRKWGGHSNIHAWKNLVTNSVIMGWDKLEET